MIYFYRPYDEVLNQKEEDQNAKETIEDAKPAVFSMVMSKNGTEIKDMLDYARHDFSGDEKNKKRKEGRGRN